MQESDRSSSEENAPSKLSPAASALPVVYACSGCSDAGELADHVARALHKRGLAEMSCLAGVGGRVKHLVKKAAEAEEVLVVDGCPISCAKNTLKLAGIEKFHHLGLHDLGLRKGNCPVTDQSIEQGVEAATQLIHKVK